MSASAFRLVVVAAACCTLASVLAAGCDSTETGENSEPTAGSGGASSDAAAGGGGTAGGSAGKAGSAGASGNGGAAGGSGGSGGGAGGVGGAGGLGGAGSGGVPPLSFTPCTPSPPTAATYYVATTGLDTNPGTQDSPWKTLQKAAATLVAGETVYIRAGTYDEQLVPHNSGTASGGCITYAAYPGETVTLDGNSLSLGTWDGLVHVKADWINGVKVRKSYIRISGLRVINAKGGPDTPDYDIHGIRVDESDYIVVEKNSTYNTRSSGIGVWNGTYVVVDGNDIGLACNIGGPDNKPGVEENLSIDGSSFVEVRGNYVHDGATFPTGWSGGEGINVKDGSSNIRVFHNVVHLKPVDGSPSTRLAYGLDAWNSTVNTHDIEYFGNIAYESHYGFIVSSEQGGTVENVKVYNNIAYNNTGAGFSIPWWSGTLDGVKRNIQFINNTSYHNDYGFSNQSPLNENVVVQNNIFSQNGTNVLVESGTEAQTTVDQNLFDGTGGTVGSNAVVGDPLFVSAGAADFHLQSGSPAINSGSPVNAPNNDFEGNARPQPAGGNYDIGAYEYVSPP